MNYRFAPIAALAFLCLARTTHAQYRDYNHFPDSIQVEFPEQKAQVIFELRRYTHDQSTLTTFTTDLREWLPYIQRALPANFREAEPRHITLKLKPESEKLIINSAAGNFYKPEGKKTEFIISSAAPETYVLVRESTIEQLLPPGWELCIQSNQATITVYASTFEGLEALAQQNFEMIVHELNNDPAMKVIGRKRIQSRFIVREGKINQRIINYIYQGDFLFLTGHAGVGLLQDKFYPELSGSIGIYFKDHFNKQNQRLELLYNAMFFTEKKIEGGYRSQPNTFLSLAYGRNFSSARAQWTTLGAGLLIHKEGDYFQGKTVKFFISSDIGSTKLNIVPEFYLTNDFKKFLFGIKLNYTF